MNRRFELPKNQVSHTSINADIDNFHIVYISPSGSWQIKELGYLEDVTHILEIDSYKTNTSSFPDTYFTKLNRMKDRVKSNRIGKRKGDQKTDKFGSYYGGLSPTSTSDSLEKCSQSTVKAVTCLQRGTNNPKRNPAKKSQLSPNKIITKFKFINNYPKYDSSQHFSNSGRTSDYDSDFFSISDRESRSEAYNDSSNKKKSKNKNNNKRKTSEERGKFNKKKYACMENESDSKLTSSDEQSPPFPRRQHISDIVSDNLSVLELVCSGTTDECDVGDITPFNSVECKKVTLKDKIVTEESLLIENQKDSKNKQVVPDIFPTLNKKSIQPQLEIDAFPGIHGSQTIIYDPDYVNSCSNTKAKLRLKNDKSESIFLSTQELGTDLQVLPHTVTSPTKIGHVSPDSGMKVCKTDTHKNNLQEKINMSSNKVIEEKSAIAGFNKISDCTSNNSLSKSTEAADFSKTELNVNSTIKRELKKKMEKKEIKSKSKMAVYKSHKITACVNSQEEICAQDKKDAGLYTETIHEVQKIGSTQDEEQKMKNNTDTSTNANEKHLFEEPLQQKGCNDMNVDLDISPRINHMESQTKTEMCSSSSICKSKINKVNSIDLNRCKNNLNSDSLVLHSEKTQEKLKRQHNSVAAQNQPIEIEEITQLEIIVKKNNINNNNNLNNNRTNEEGSLLVEQPQKQVKKEGKTTSIVDTKLETGKMFNTDNSNKPQKIKMKTNSTKGTGINSFEDSQKQTDFLNSAYPLETNKAVKQTVEKEISTSNSEVKTDQVIGTGTNPEEMTLLEKSEKLVMSDASVGNLHSEFKTGDNVSPRKSKKHKKVMNSNKNTSLEGNPVSDEAVKQTVEKEIRASNFSSEVKIDQVIDTGANPEEMTLLEESEKLDMSDASDGDLHAEFKTEENVSPRKSKKHQTVMNSNNNTSLEGNPVSDEVVKQTVEKKISASNFSSEVEIDQVIDTGANPEEMTLLEESEKLDMSDASVGDLHAEFKTEENFSTKSKKDKKVMNSNNDTSLEGNSVSDEAVKQIVLKEISASNFSSEVKIDQVIDTGANPEEMTLLEKSEKLDMSDTSVGDLHAEFKTEDNVSPRKSKKHKKAKLISNNITCLEGNPVSDEAVKQTVEKEISASNFSSKVKIDEVIDTGANPEEMSLLEKSENLDMSDASVRNLHPEFKTDENVSPRKSKKYKKVKLNSNNSTSLEGNPMSDEAVTQTIEKEISASNLSSEGEIDEVIHKGSNAEEMSSLEESEKLDMTDASVGNLHSEFKTEENVTLRKSKKYKKAKWNSNNSTSLEANRMTEEVQDTLMNDTDSSNVINEIKTKKKKDKKYKLKLGSNITTEEKFVSEDVQEITGNCLDVLQGENVSHMKTIKHKDRSTDSEILNTNSDGSGYHVPTHEPCRKSKPQSIPIPSKRKLDLSNSETISKKHKNGNTSKGKKNTDETTAAEEKQNSSDCVDSTKHSKDDPGNSGTNLSLYTPSKKVKKHKEDKVMGSNKTSIEPVFVSSTPFPGRNKEKKKLTLFGDNSSSNITSSDLDRSINSLDITILEEIQSQIITSSSDLKRLENLNINIDWELSPLHKIDTGSSRNNLQRLKEKLEPPYSFNTNKFTTKEENLIKRSWEEFSQAYNFEDPELFFPSRQNFGVFSRQERHNFKLFLAKYLPDRRLYSVYNKFCALYGVESRGRWSEKEDQLLLELYFAFQEENSLDDEDDENCERKQSQVKFAFTMKKIMQKALRRSWSSINNRLKILLQNEHARNLTCQDITWTSELEGKLLHNLLKKSKANSVEDLRYATIPYKVWRKVATKMDLPFDKILNQWKYHLYPQLFARFPILRHKLYIQLIKWFYKSDIRDWKTINWADLSRRSGDLGSCYLCRVFKTLVRNVVPKYIRKHFRDCVIFLHEHYIPELKQKKKSHVLIRKYYDPETRMLNLREEDELDCPQFRIK